jgi:hypothetical protein
VRHRADRNGPWFLGDRGISGLKLKHLGQIAFFMHGTDAVNIPREDFDGIHCAKFLFICLKACNFKTATFTHETKFTNFFLKAELLNLACHEPSATHI